MKKILALVLALCMIFALCACGQSAAPAEQPAKNEAPAADGAAPPKTRQSRKTWATPSSSTPP